MAFAPAAVEAEQLVKQFFLAEHLTGTRSEDFEQGHLSAFQLHLTFADHDAAVSAIKGDVAADDHIGRFTAAAPAQQHAGTRLQFAKIEGLHQIIICAEIQCADPVVYFGPCGQHEHRDANFGLPQPLQDGETVETLSLIHI